MEKRNSSIEIFRIISTILVLIVHFNGWFVEISNHFTSFNTITISQAIIEMLSCTCVNCFLVITGWFGLKFKWKHIITIWSVLAFIYVPFYIINCYLTNSFSIIKLLFNFIAIGKESYYIQCYLILLIISPILNVFIKQYGKRIAKYVVLLWGIEILFDCIFNNKCLGFNHGFGLSHFILMYLLGQTCFLYKKEIESYINTYIGIGIYLLGAGILFSLYVFLPLDKVISYSNPINVIMSFNLFFIFERRNFYNKGINIIAKSSLTVYIYHITSPVINYLQYLDNYILNNYSYMSYLLLISLIIIIVFFIGVLYDQIRNLCMNKINNYLTKKLNNISII